MPIVQFEHAIKDFAAWKAAFDRDPIDRRGLGVRRHRIQRPTDDANCILGELEFDTTTEANTAVEALQRLWSSTGAAPALLGAPRVRIVEIVDELDYETAAAS